MQPGTLRALEFDRIVDAVRNLALTPMGSDRLARLGPSTEAHRVAHLLAQTSETARFVAAHGAFPLRAAADLPNSLAALAVEGRPLEPLRLLALATFLESIDESRAAIRRTPGAFQLLEAAVGGAASFKHEVSQVRAKIDPAGDVVDDASPQLKMLRDRLRKQRSRLRTTLESYLRGKETSKYLQDQVVTERNGRYVLVVKTEHRSGIPGIVHGASTSGASLFLEPLSTVEINNDIVTLEEQEAEEIRKILLALTELFRVRGAIKVIPPATALLITGPNTGGKTVALKTAGLLSLMAQSGLRIPAADGSRVPVFQSLFADIGDEQSIEASLSTFSAHVANIVSMDRSLVTPALVLLDE